MWILQLLVYFIKQEYLSLEPESPFFWSITPWKVSALNSHFLREGKSPTLIGSINKTRGHNHRVFNELGATVCPAPSTDCLIFFNSLQFFPLTQLVLQTPLPFILGNLVQSFSRIPETINSDFVYMSHCNFPLKTCSKFLAPTLN